MKILGASLFSLDSKRLRLTLSESVELVQKDGTKRKSQVIEISLSRLAMESGDEIANLLSNTVVEKVPAMVIAMAFIGVVCDISITDYKKGDTIVSPEGKSWTCEENCSQVHLKNLNRQNWRFESQVMSACLRIQEAQFAALERKARQNECNFTAPNMQ